ncbi:MAG: LysR family transcriptional regulator [Chloroflexi bacterium]|nr:LysR family transcriptional regulator [Chloroflexota bacterium]
MKISGKHLQSFFWVLRLGSYRRTAEQLDISQAAVYRSVRSLERSCGIQLIRREGGKITPTHAGRVLQEYAERIETLHSAAEESIAEMVRPRSPVLLFGVTHNFALDVARCMGGWEPQDPNLRVAVVVGLRGELHTRVLEGEMHFAFASAIGMPPGLAVGDAVFEDEMVFVGPAGHPLSKRRVVSLAELSQERLVDFLPGSTSHSILMEIAEKTGARLNIVGEVDHTEVGIELVASGFGISVRSRRTAAESIRLGRLSEIPVVGFPRRIPYGFVFRSEAPLSEAARSLIEHLTACLSKRRAQVSHG